MASPQHEVKPAASLVHRREADKEEPSLYATGEGHGRHRWSWSRCPRTSRRMGRGMVRRWSWELEMRRDKVKSQPVVYECLGSVSSRINLN